MDGVEQGRDAWGRLRVAGQTTWSRTAAAINFANLKRLSTDLSGEQSLVRPLAALTMAYFAGVSAT